MREFLNDAVQNIFKMLNRWKAHNFDKRDESRERRRYRQMAGDRKRERERSREREIQTK